jgi:hypothetical protein
MSAAPCKLSLGFLLIDLLPISAGVAAEIDPAPILWTPG